MRGKILGGRELIVPSLSCSYDPASCQLPSLKQVHRAHSLSRTNNQIPFSSNWSFLVGRKDTAMSADEEGSDGLGSEGRRDTCDLGRRRGTGRMGLTRTAGITGSQCRPSAARGSFFKLALGSSGPDSRVSSFLSP